MSAEVLSDSVVLSAHADSLARRGAPFDQLLERNGPPPLWRRSPTYATLVRFILEQQVSLASATAAFGRLAERVGEVTPESVLASTADELRADGFSRQKTGYVSGIAERIRDGSFRLPTAGEDPAEARERLMSLSGIGPWTASCYLLFVLGEPDVWPDGDRALHVALAAVLELADPPTTGEAVEIASSWSPHRSTAARMLWHDYLGGRDYVVDPAAGFL